MNTDGLPPDSAPDEPIDASASGENQNAAKKIPRRHLHGLPPGYKFDPNAKPTLDDLYGVPACFGDDETLHKGQSRTESDGLAAGA